MSFYRKNFTLLTAKLRELCSSKYLNLHNSGSVTRRLVIFCVRILKSLKIISSKFQLSSCKNNGVIQLTGTLLETGEIP